MLHMQLKRRTNRAILSAMLLSLLLAAEAVPAQAAGRAELAMDGKAVPSGTVVAMPEGSVAAFSLKLDGSLGTGYTSGNGAVAQTGTVQRFSDGEAVYAVKAIGQLGERAGLYIDGEKVLEIEIAAGAACPACQKTGCASVQVEYGAWHTDGEQRACSHFAYGQDAREAMDAYNAYRCAACGAASQLKTGTAHRWICHGSRG